MLAAGLTAWAHALLACGPPPEIRHVVVVSLDTIGARHVSAYGYDRETTPHLDAVAAGGVLFENAYAPQLWTLTSHITMMTGLHPEVHGVTKRRPASPSAVTLAEILRERGFATAAFTGAGGWLHPGFGLGRGFDTYEMGRHDAQTDAARATAWLREQADQLETDPEYRFFLFVHFFDAHSGGKDVPYYAPPPYGARYLPEGSRWERGGSATGLNELAKQGPSELDREIVTAYYDAAVSYVDAEGLAPVVDTLRELGLDDETLLVVTSDHGEEIFEHGGVLHRQPYDETTRVPLVFRGPGIPAGERVAELAALVDLTPTVLSLLSLPIPAHMQGRDLAPLWRGAGPVNDAVYVDGGDSHGFPYQSSVIADVEGRRWSYITTVRRAGKPLFRQLVAQGPRELYALDDDPEQRRNVAAQHPEVARGLEARLLAWFRDNETRARRLGRSRETQLLTPEEQGHLEALGYVE